jgi:hypothetical protein
MEVGQGANKYWSTPTTEVAQGAQSWQQVWGKSKGICWATTCTCVAGRAGGKFTKIYKVAAYMETSAKCVAG